MAGYLAISDAIIGEGDEKATFIVTLFGAAPSETVTVSYGTIELTADGTDDYSGIAFGQLTFSPGETSKTIVVDINNDSIQEQTEYFSVRLVNNSANSIITKEIGIGMLYDDDTQTADLPYIQTDNYVINEIDRFVDVVVRLSSVSSKAITVNYATVADTAASGQDFTIRSGTLTFAAGETVKTIRVNVRNDGIFEPEERFFFDLSNASNAIVADARAEIRIAGHSQLQALPLISVSDIILDESAGLARFEVSLSSPTNNLVTVLSQIGPGSIGQGDILNTMGSSSSVRQLVFEPGETIKTIDIVIGDDQSIEQLETFFVSLSNASNASIAKSIGLGSIVDNDFISADGPYLTIENTVVDEHAGTAEVLVRMSAVATQTVSVDYATVGGTGRPGLDFGGVHGTLIFLPGETLQKIRIDLVDDTRPELEEMFQILLSNARNATIGHDLGEVWIVGDTAEQPTAYLRVDNLTIGEGDGLARFELSLSAPIAEPVTVTYFAGPQAGQIDYALSNTFGITTFMPGETVKTIALNIIDDRLIEGTEVFAFQIGSSNSNVTVVEPISILTIVDNDTDSLGDSYIVMDDIVVNEQNGHAQVTVHLTKPSNDIIKVDYHTINGSARAGSDYIDRSGELMFMPGETAKTVRLGLIDDAEAEGNEHLFLQLTSAEGAVLAEDIAAIRIANNDGRSDGLPTISIGDVTVSEGDKVARFEVTLSSASIDTVSYRLALAGTTAGLGTDFGHPLGSSVFAPGETVKIVTVGIGDDTLREATEAFEVRLSNVSNARIGDALGIGTIVDNDTSTPAGPRITGSNIIVNEGDGYATFAVNLTQRNAGPVTVEYALVNGTARVGADVVQQTGTLTFLPADTSETVRFRLLDDLLPENAETFALRLFGAQGAQFVSGSELRLTATINDNDAAPYRATLARESFVASATVSTVDYVFSDKLVAVNLTSGRGAGGYAAGDTFSGIANIYGSAHNDRLTGDAAINVFDGRAGNDLLRALGGDDSLQGNVGDDRLDGGTGDDLLRGGVGNDFLIGGIGDDSLLGDAGDDRLVGGAGNDRLVGGAGNDIIDGGIGIDILTGNTGIDVFVFNRPADGVDIVTDFNRAADVLSLVSAVRGFDGSAASATGFVAFTVSGRDTILRLDANGGGDGFVDLAILKNVTGLTVGVGLRDGWLDLE